MSLELDYWRRISRCEVPGLELHFYDNDELNFWHCIVKYDGEFALVDDEPNNSSYKHRAAAMLVVDALEAAGLFYFDRSTAICNGVFDLCWEAGFDVKHSRIGSHCLADHGGKEHLALLALLAEVVVETVKSAT